MEGRGEKGRKSSIAKNEMREEKNEMREEVIRIGMVETKHVKCQEGIACVSFFAINWMTTSLNDMLFR